MAAVSVGLSVHARGVRSSSVGAVMSASHRVVRVACPQPWVRGLVWVGCSLGLAMVAAFRVEAEPATAEPALPAPHGVVDLGEAGFATGLLVPAPPAPGGRDALRWQSGVFAAPIDLRLDAMRGVRFRAPEPIPVGGRRVHLRGGDVVSGSLVRLDDETLTLDLDLPGRQRVRIDRAEIESIAAPGAGGGSFDGPGGLLGWRQSPPDTWREEAGRLLGDLSGSAIARDVAAPPRARFDVVLSWRVRPECRLVLAAGDDGVDRFWLEVVDTDDGPVAMLVRREAESARLERIACDLVDSGRLRLVLFIDQAVGRLAAIVPTADGRDAPVADVTLAPADGNRSQGGFRLALGAGDVCLESLRVTPWQTDDPSLDDATGAVVVTTTARLADVTITGFDATAAASWTIERGGTPLQLPDADVREVRFAAPADAPPAAVPETGLRLVLANGDRLSGDLHAVDDAGPRLTRRGIAEPLSLPYASLVVMQAGRSAPQAELPGREGTLTAEGISMRGCLVAAAGDPEDAVARPAAGVGWLPLGGPVPSRFRDAGVAATIEFVAPDTQPTAGEDWVGGIGGVVNQDPEGRMTVSMLTDDGAAARDGRILPGDRILAIRCRPNAAFVDTAGLDTETVMNLLRGRVGTPVGLRVAGLAGPPREVELARGAIGVFGRDVLRTALETHARFAAAPVGGGDAGAHPAVVFLRSGDVVRCRIERIDESGVRLTTSAAPDPDATRDVPASALQAIELVPTAPSRVLDAVRVERLLTVPRMQRDRPPTHLLRLLDGDYVRGRLESLDATTARIEIHGIVQEVPRSAIARVIWLHPADDEAPADADDPAGGEASVTTGLAVRAEWGDGRRLGLVATDLVEGHLRGTNSALGEVVVPIDAVDRLRLGAAAVPPAERPYAQWTLRPATLPRALRADPAEADAAKDPVTPSP
jgi:hypothetical protein